MKLTFINNLNHPPIFIVLNAVDGNFLFFPFFLFSNFLRTNPRKFAVLRNSSEVFPRILHPKHEHDIFQVADDDDDDDEDEEDSKKKKISSHPG